MASTPNLPATPNVGLTNLAVSTTINTPQTVFTAGASGSKVVGVLCASADSTARDVNLYITRGGVNFLIGRVQVAASAGNVNNVPVAMLLVNTNIGLPLDNDGQPYLLLKSGDTLTVQLPVTNAGVLSLTVIGADF